MTVLILTMLVFSVAIFGLAIGVLVSEKKVLRGSCGGPDMNPECCQTCPDKVKCDDEGEYSHPLLQQTKATGPESGRPFGIR